MRRDANAITAEDGEGTTHIPSATIGVLSLGSCAPTGAAEGACAAAHPHVRGALGWWPTAAGRPQSRGRYGVSPRQAAKR